MAKNNGSAGNVDIARLLDDADIVRVAQGLGLNLDAKQSRPRRALCPFHNDTSPSLNLYQSGKGRDHYHCYSCGAHGDALSLVQHRSGVDFWEAIEKLADLCGVRLAAIRRSGVDRRTGARFFADKVIALSDDTALLRFAELRQLPEELLRKIGAGVIDMKAIVAEAQVDRVIFEKLSQAGVLKEAEIKEPGLFPLRPTPFFFDPRIVIPINDLSGSPVGFAARAISDSPRRYLYSYNFPRRDTLYGADRVRTVLERSQQRGKPACIYIVEGIFDQLRLESLGMQAVAILGSKMTPGQVDCLSRLAETADNANSELTVRIFLDPDDAGRRGTFDTILTLMQLLDAQHSFALEVIMPRSGEIKLDPDAFLRGQSTVEADAALDQAKISPLRVLLASEAALDVHQLNAAEIGNLKLTAAARRIANALPSVNWDRVFATLPAEDEFLGSFEDLIRLYGDRKPMAARELPLIDREASDERADLITALTVGRSSTERREYPLDDDAWERLAVAATPFFHIHRHRLAVGDGPSAPLLARHVPKGSGRYRLKSGPVAHDSLLQQYALTELLRDRLEAPGFASLVPAIRYSDDRSETGSIYRTGAGGEREALSFAYQVDMAIVNGDAPPRREGIYRPYFDCWRSFIDFLDRRIRNYRHEEVQILRLDVSGFYEYVKSDVVGDSLQIPLEIALAQFGASDGGVGGFARLLQPDRAGDASERAGLFTRFLLRHSFGLSHRDPVTGALDTVKGLPQGPELSAYLANISLFSLDDIMADEIGRIDRELTVEGEVEGRCSAAYARYVDDIILVCPTVELAAQLRRKIEAHLQLKGLSLNRKNTTPPPMTRTEAREWLTDNRSGFGFSGPLSEMPVTEAMDPLADAGEIDRKTALGLMYDPELDDLRNSEEILDRISLALKATEVRFGDRANAYKRLWQLAGKRSEVTSPEALVREFWRLVRDVELPSFENSDDATDTALTCIEALDRALRARVPEGVEPAIGEISLLSQKNIASAVLRDLFTPLAIAIFGAENYRAFLGRYDVRCHVAIIACVSVALHANGPKPFERLKRILDSADGNVVPLPEGLRLSLYRHQADFGELAQPLTVPSTHQIQATFQRLEAALVRLQRLEGGGEDLPQSQVNPSHIQGLDRISALILRIWSPDDSSHVDEPIDRIELDAASTLVNVTYQKFAFIAASRPRLITIIAGQKNAQALPSPPGLASSGILLWCDDNRLLLASPENDNQVPKGVDWEAVDNSAVNGVRLLKALLPEKTVPLYLHQLPWTAERIASTYRSGIGSYSTLLTPGAEEVPVPTAFSFFASIESGAIEPSSLKLICWTAPRTSVDGHAFIRNGTALEAISVHADGADYWRYGWAVRDLCEHSYVPTDNEGSIDDHADTSLDQSFHREEAMLARILPRLSGADRWGVGVFREGTTVPTRIQRALSLLEAFGRSSSIVEQSAYLVAAAADSMFMSERLTAIGDQALPGRPAAYAARAAHRVSRALPAAAIHWPTTNFSDVESCRRSAVAWFALSKRLQDLMAGLSDDAVHRLSVLSLGSEVLAAVSELRALAFELASTLPIDSLEQLGKTQLDLSFAVEQLGLEAALIDVQSANVDVSLEGQVGRLFDGFHGIIAGRRGASASVRDAITPLGWCLIVSTLLQVVSPVMDAAGLRPTLWSMTSEALNQARQSLRELIAFLGAKGQDDGKSEDWPWLVLSNLQSANPPNLKELLADISRAAGLIITIETSWSDPRTGEIDRGRSILRFTDGTTQRFADWQIDIAFIKGERRASTECDEIGERRRYRYSTSRRGERILGVHLVSNSLAEVAFNSGTSIANSSNSSVTKREGTHPQIASANGEKTFDEVSLTAPPPSLGDGATSTPAQVEEEVAAERAVPEGNVEQNISSEDVQYQDMLSGLDVIAEIRKFQSRNWQDRSAKAIGLQRIALVQWDVVDTYYSPSHGDGRHEGLIASNEDPGSFSDRLKIGGVFVSTAEARRRTILREILQACAKFRVDGLILPEYSVRPETVNWISRQLRQLNLALVVWCGTFRVPDGSTVLSNDRPSKALAPFSKPVLPAAAAGMTPWDSHAALLTCLESVPTDVSSQVNWYVRRKRYPSAAANELIRPPVDEPWRPLLSGGNDADAFRLGSFTAELVCSEIFPHASSANYIGVLEENRKLAARYGLIWSTENAEQALTDDVRTFAKWTAYRNGVEGKLGRGNALQRTIMILPAMTSRSADYHIFGQNQYLAAGLVTAFCNAVLPPVSCGNSAFIGLDGWKSAAPVATPYGSIAPGIFQLGDAKSSHTGPLGNTEAAMVIADLDPIRTADQRPRPHYQTRALELVAHLPLIFSTEAGDRKGDAATRRLRKRGPRSEGSKSREFAEAARAILRVFESKESWRNERAHKHADGDVQAAQDKIRLATIEALGILEDYADDPAWLRKRTEAFKAQRWTYSPPGYLPALTDWLYIDDRYIPVPVDLSQHPLEADDPLLDIPRSSNA